MSQPEKTWSDGKKWIMGILSTLIIALLVGGVGYLFKGNDEEDNRVVEYCELLRPMIVQLDRTKAAFKRWNAGNLYLEAKIIREGNLAIRNLLIDKSHLVHIDLQDGSKKLIEHYDRWLEEFDEIRGGNEPDLNTPFVFVGPKGYPFPKEAEKEFRLRTSELMEKIGELPCH